MASFNKIILVGNLTRDPEMRQLPSGQSTCRLGLATNRQFKNRQTGAITQEVCFIDIDVWGAQAESCRQFLQKGKQILVEGRLKYDQWQDAQGQQRNKHSIVADSITFLNSASRQDEVSVSDDETIFDVTKSLDKDIDSKSAFKGAKKESSKKSSSFTSGEVNFSDTPPFDSELPF